MNPETELLRLATEQFTNLSPAEEKLFRSVAKGERVNFSGASDEENDPNHADKWSAERALNADRIAWLCTNPASSKLVTHCGIIIEGAQVNGAMVLDFADITFPLLMQKCVFSESIFLNCTNLNGLYLIGTHIKDLQADEAKIEKSVHLRDGFKAEGEVRLIGTTIGKDFNCCDGQFINAGKKALIADGVNIGGACYLRKVKAEGEVRFPSATIKRDFDCQGGQFSNAEEKALFADGIEIGGSVHLRNNFKAEGEVRFLGATIGRNMECDGGQFSNAEGKALFADGIEIGGSVHLRNNFKAEGEVRFPTANIGKDFNCDSGQFKTITADGVNIGGACYLRKVKAEGEVRFLGATIGRSMECDGGQFNNTNSFALLADGIKINGSLLLRNGFEANGKLSFISAYVARHFQLRDANLPEIILDLCSAKVGTFWDEEKSWPKAGNLLLNGFVYDEIHHFAPTDAKTRINWLKRQPISQFLPQPYEQLAGVLRKKGHEKEADKVMIEKNDNIAHRINLFHPMRWLQFFFKLFVGYGYRPWRAFRWSLIVILLGTILFSSGNQEGIMTPSKIDAYVLSSPGTQQLSENYPQFNSLIYSLEMFTPLLKLEMGNYWQPNANRGKRHIVREISLPTDGSFLRGYLWFHIILGWVLTTLWVGALTGLVKK